jgi:hypothetical protein
MAGVPSSSRGGGGASDLAAVLTEGNDAEETGIDNLGLTTLAGKIETFGWAIQGTEESASPTLSLSNSLNGSAGLQGGTPGADLAGGSASLDGGRGSDSGTSGAGVFAQGGRADGVTHGRLNFTSANTSGTAGETLVTDGTWATFQDLGAIKLDTHAAPADGALAAGDLYLWFDQTNGSAKLMVKAKQANGTVVTAAVALA